MVVGERTLGETMKNISREAKLSKCYTSHSIRATAVTILDKSGFEARHIMAVSGHKNEASIRSYSKTDIYTRKKMSESLTIRCEVSEELSVMNSHQSSPVLSLSQEEVILNSSRSEITKNFNVTVRLTYSKLDLFKEFVKYFQCFQYRSCESVSRTFSL